MEKDNWRLGLHLMPPQGWLYDPNGLCWYQGEYHVFFQYSPDNAEGGLKHWGHYKSKDMLEWEFTGIPVKAEEAYEKDGAYSGCAFVEADVMHLFYTGNVKEAGNHDYITSGRGANVIHAIYTAEGELTEKKCILTNADYPAYYTCHVRDPKVWKENDTYYMVLGGRDREDEGRVLVYVSENLLDWTFLKDIVTPEAFGYMWECPDYFEIDGKKILSVSPQGLETRGHDYENIYQSGYFCVEGSVTDEAESGSGNSSVADEAKSESGNSGVTGEAESESRNSCATDSTDSARDCDGGYELHDFTEWDHGFDFYAPQTFEDQKGRRILIGWMGIPDADYTNPTVERGWQHALTLPRVLTWKNGIVSQNPVEELKELRKNCLQLKQGEEVTFDLAELLLKNEKNQKFTITVAQGMKISYDKEKHDVTLCFEDEVLGAGRTVRHCDVESVKEMQVMLDRSAVEVYINHGEKVMTTRYYPVDDERTVRIEGTDIWTSLWTLRDYHIL